MSGRLLLIEAASPASLASRWPSLITCLHSRFMASIRRISGALSANGRKRAADSLEMTTNVLKNKIKMWLNNRLIKCLSNLSGVCIQNFYQNSWKLFFSSFLRLSNHCFGFRRQNLFVSYISQLPLLLLNVYLLLNYQTHYVLCHSDLQSPRGSQ